MWDSWRLLVCMCVVSSEFITNLSEDYTLMRCAGGQIRQEKNNLKIGNKTAQTRHVLRLTDLSSFFFLSHFMFER